VSDRPEQRKVERVEMARMTDRLVVEFAHSHSPETVTRCTARCRGQLLETGVRHGLVAATEAAARVVLTRTKPVHARP
jgi:hypothetical protein